MKRHCGRVAFQLAIVAAAACSVAAGATDAPLASPSATAPDAQDIIFLGPLRPLLLRLHVTIDGEPFRQVWQARFDEIFGLEDRDGDGRLELEQAAAVVRDMNGGLKETPGGNLKELMPEGTIDRATLRTYIERALPPFVLRPRAVIGQGSALALFPLLDTDHDQRLTAGELAAAEMQLLQRDFDDNRVITPGELILDPKAIAAASDPNASEEALDPDDSAVLVVDELLTGSRFAERLLKHYDRDKDGRLATSGTQIEIKLPALLLSRVGCEQRRGHRSPGARASGGLAPRLGIEFCHGAGQRARRACAAQAVAEAGVSRAQEAARRLRVGPGRSDD